MCADVVSGCFNEDVVAYSPWRDARLPDASELYPVISLGFRGWPTRTPSVAAIPVFNTKLQSEPLSKRARLCSSFHAPVASRSSTDGDSQPCRSAFASSGHCVPGSRCPRVPAWAFSCRSGRSLPSPPLFPPVRTPHGFAPLLSPRRAGIRSAACHGGSSRDSRRSRRMTNSPSLFGSAPPTFVWIRRSGGGRTRPTLFWFDAGPWQRLALLDRSCRT